MHTPTSLHRSGAHAALARLCAFALLLSAARASPLTPELQKQVRAATFELVLKKPEKESVTNEKRVPLELMFIMPEPGLNHASAYVRAELATTKNGEPSYELGAAAGGPIVDNVLGFRLSASFRRDGGWVDRASYTLTPNPVNPVLPTPVFNPYGILA